MFGFLKKLGKKNGAAVVAAPAAVPAAVTVTPSPAQAAPAPNGAHRRNGGGAATPQLPNSRGAARTAMPAIPNAGRGARVTPASAAKKPAEPAAPPIPVPSAKPPPAVMVEISLKKLWTKLNPEILRMASAHPDDNSFLRLPLPLLQAQLAKGAIKLPLIQFRQYAPPELFQNAPEDEAMEVEIPISDVIPLIKPEHFSRRPNQRKLEVPDDIGPVFGPGSAAANGLRVAEQKSRSKSAGGASPAEPITPASAAPASFPAPVLPTAPAQAEIPAPVLPKISPIAPLPVPESRAPIAAPVSAPIVPKSPLPPPPAAPIPMPMVLAPTPTIAATTLPKPPAARTGNAIPAAPVPAQVARAGESKPLEGTLTLALMDVAAFWSEKGRSDLGNLYRHTLEIPLNTLEKALKTGQLVFQWREVRPWLRLSPGNSMPTLEDELPVELPLSIIAPRFLEARGATRAKPKLDLGDIPDVFEQKIFSPSPSDAPSMPPLGATAVPMENVAALNSASKTGDTAFLKRTAGKPLLEFGEIFGQPEKKNWTLSEVAQKTLGLRGVAGAIIGTSDGLLVAGNWPGGPKNDAVAAFVPQMYGKILQYSKELKIGEPTSFMLTAENVPLQVFKTGDSFLTVIGRAGQNLPKAQLNAVANRLATMK